MRPKWVVLVVSIASFSGVASASYLGTCASVVGGSSLLSTLLADVTSGNSCSAGDVLYNNFSYSATGNQTAANVTTTFSSVTGAFSGLALDASWNAANGGFTWSYTATICNVAGCLAAPLTTIKTADVQENPGGATATLTNTINGNAANTSPGNLSIVQGQPGGTLSVNFSDSYTSTAGTFLTGVRNDVYEQVGPEPGTMLLMSGALVGLGFIGRKRIKKA